jgi:hypothetical protein
MLTIKNKKNTLKICNSPGKFRKVRSQGNLLPQKLKRQMGDGNSLKIHRNLCGNQD